MTDETNDVSPFKDPVNVRLLRNALERMRTGRHPLLRDLAADVLSGRVEFRDAGNSPEVAQALRDSVRHYRHWRASVSDEDFASLANQVNDQVEALRRRLDDDDDRSGRG